MAPIVYKIAPSPPSRAVMIVAELTGAPVIYRDVNLAKAEHMQAAYVKKNPLHTVPFLEDGDLLLEDSHAIAAYLVDRYAKNEQAKLYPKVLKRRAIVDARLHFDSSILFVRTGRIVRNVLLHGATGATNKEIEELEEAYSFLDALLSRSEWLAGEHLTIADICTATSMSGSNVVLPLNTDKYTNVAAWVEKMNGFPWFQKINAPGAQMFMMMYRKFLEDNASRLTNGE